MLFTGAMRESNLKLKYRTLITQFFYNSNALLQNLSNPEPCLIIRVLRGTIWTLLHNQKNQSFLAIYAANCQAIATLGINIDNFLCLNIICSHFLSIKWGKIRVFSKFTRNPEFYLIKF